MKGFQTSGELMEAVRVLDYKAQYKVCEAFYKVSKGFDWSDRLMFQLFEESFSIDRCRESGGACRGAALGSE